MDVTGCELMQSALAKLKVAEEILGQLEQSVDKKKELLDRAIREVSHNNGLLEDLKQEGGKLRKQLKASRGNPTGSVLAHLQSTITGGK